MSKPYRFLVAVKENGRGRASMVIEPQLGAQNRKNIGEFYRKYAEFDIRECSGEEMKELMS